jgi:RNA polymerase sigma-70 factor (ECF subfamily)
MQEDPTKQATGQCWNSCLEQVAASRDKAAFMAFYDHFAPRLNSWLLSSTKNSSLAEELVQEAMLSVWRKAELFDSSKSSASTWLFRIARNLHIDYLRKEKNRLRDSELRPDSEVTLFECNPDSSKIHQAMRDLPLQQAQVIYKSYFEGKSHQEISDDMDIPLGSVKSSLRLAFQKLSKAMRPQL